MGQLHTASPVRQPDGQMIPVGYKKIHIFKYKQHAKAIHKHDHQTNPLTFPAFSLGIPGQCVMDHQRNKNQPEKPMFTIGIKKQASQKQYQVAIFFRNSIINQQKKFRINRNFLFNAIKQLYNRCLIFLIISNFTLHFISIVYPIQSL